MSATCTKTQTSPDDDLGRAVLWELLNQLVLNGAAPDKVRKRGIDLLPEIDDDDSLDDMLKDIGAGRKRKSNDIACNIGLDFQRRDRLQIRFIGCCDKSKAERKAIYAQLKAANQRWKREQDRAMGIKAKLRPKREEAQGTGWSALEGEGDQPRGMVSPAQSAAWQAFIGCAVGGHGRQPRHVLPVPA